MNPRLWSKCFVVAVVFAVMGMLVASIPIMAIGSALAGLSYALEDYLSPEADSISPMTVHALFAGIWMGGSHFLAYMALDTKFEDTFFAYTVFDYVLQAQYLATLISIVPLVTYRIAQKLAVGRQRTNFIPRLELEFSDKALMIVVCALIVSDLLGTFLAISLYNVFFVGPLLRIGAFGAIFLLTWHWYGPQPTLAPWTRLAVPILMLFKSTIAFLYNDMRGEIVYPIFAFSLAILLRKAIQPWMIIAAISFLIPFSYVYAVIGELKSQNIKGSERIAVMVGDESAPRTVNEDDASLEGAAMRLAARACIFGQLTQVIRVADDDGLYYGETIAYLTYVFIPRALWPDKPAITPGQWFARRLGKGSELSTGNFSNSINMTLAGEFYLNFGWLGALAGLIVFGLTFWIFWQRTAIFDHQNNIVGLTLAFVLLFQGAYASSAAALPQIVIGYGSMLLLYWAVTQWNRRRAIPAIPGLDPRQSETVG